MKVSTFNAFFRKIGEAQIKFRWVFLAVFVPVTVFCCAGLKDFAFALGDEGWFGGNDEIKINQKKYEEIFGNLNGLGCLLVMQDGREVFSEDILHVIDKIGSRLKDEIPYADRLTSIINVDIPVGNEEGFEVVKPFGNGIPSDPAELAKKRDFIMRGSEKNNALINSMVSDDGKETWIFLSLLPYGTDEDIPLEIGYKFIDIIEGADFQSDSYKLYGTGTPYEDANEDRYDIPEYYKRVALGFVVMLIFLAVFLRNPFGVIVPGFTTIGAIASVFGVMSYFGVKADSTLVTVPIILGMALSVGYSVHYINMFNHFFRRTGKRRESAISCVEECGWSVLFTVLTTMTSFVSFMFVKMKPLEWMGRVTALVVLAVYVYIAVLIPILLSFGKDKAPSADHEKGATKIDMKFARWADVVQKKTKLIVILSVLIMAAFIPGFFKIQVLVDFASIAGEKMPYVKTLKEMLAAKLGNQYSYTVMLAFDDDDAFKEPDNMNALMELEDFIGGLSLTKWSGGKARVSSVTSILKEMYRALNEGDEEYFKVPEDDYVLAQLLELSSIEMHDDFKDFMDDDFKITVVNVDMVRYGEKEALENVAAIKTKVKEIFPNAKCTLLGDMIQYAEMSSRIVSGGIKSFAFSFVIIAIMLILAFSSVRTGLIGMIPNVAPVILVGGVMGYLKYSLDFGTVAVMPMILGIAVDDTIHLTTHLKMGIEKSGSYKTAMEDSFREIGASMFLTTLILCAMFGVYILSPMHILVVIGVLTVVGLSSALLADYTITPALLYAVKPFGKERGE
ncbi:RND family transporter [Treponema sp. C6A8]|uniref:efflux RND transporter permease subunit n=1 Tax=Treponema sp. C6A8 TaxID=1410609 RepID=UPI0004857BFC|nr:MMPL family transporter [Treponema sp. C6A8]